MIVSWILLKKYIYIIYLYKSNSVLESFINTINWVHYTSFINVINAYEFFVLKAANLFQYFRNVHVHGENDKIYVTLRGRQWKGQRTMSHHQTNRAIWLCRSFVEKTFVREESISWYKHIYNTRSSKAHTFWEQFYLLQCRKTIVKQTGDDSIKSY